MGTCKASLPWQGGKTLLAYQCEQWSLAGFGAIAVLNPGNARSPNRAPLAAIQIVVNPNPDRGKVSSILTGLAAIPEECRAIALADVDRPRPAWILERLREAGEASQAKITAPTYSDRLGHPLIFAGGMRPHLPAIREETLGLRQLVREFADEIHRVPFADPVVLNNLNAPDAYQRELGATASKPRHSF